MHLEMLREKYIKNGYSPTTASAKICQDIILYKIAKSTLNRNVTIKGGVIMYNLSNDKRRATKDLDLDFIRYSLDDESIKGFINKLNDMDDNITIYNSLLKKFPSNIIATFGKYKEKLFFDRKDMNDDDYDDFKL